MLDNKSQFANQLGVLPIEECELPHGRSHKIYPNKDRVMATTLQAIAQFLNRRNWHYEVNAAESCITTGVRANHVERFLIVLRLSEAGQFLQFQAPRILQVPDHVYKGVLLQTMAHIEYQVKMLRLEYDPTDGEVQASIELPLEDAPLTERQFNRCLEALIQLVDQEVVPRLQAVLATGEDPGHKELTERLTEAMPLLMMAFLEKMTQLQQ